MPDSGSVAAAQPPISLRLRLASIAADIRACTACSARDEARCPVPGVGVNSGVVIVGRNPGTVEDIEGRPFRGPAGVVLDQFLATARLTRDEIFLTNLVACHTYGDRPPTPEETRTCMRLHLLRYLDTLQPFLVIPLGLDVTRAITGFKYRSLGQIHGTLFRHRRGFYVIPCYHPAAALHNPALRNAVTLDATQVRRFLHQRDQYLSRTMDGDRAAGTLDRPDRHDRS